VLWSGLEKIIPDIRQRAEVRHTTHTMGLCGHEVQPRMGWDEAWVGIYEKAYTAYALWSYSAVPNGMA